MAIENSKELEGLVLFENRNLRTNDIYLLISNGTGKIKFSSRGLAVINSPQFINIFFDPVKKRMAIKKSGAKDQNVFKLQKEGCIRNEDVLEMIFQINPECRQVESGESIYFSGKELSGFLIYDLSTYQKRKFNYKKRTS